MSHAAFANSPLAAKAGAPSGSDPMSAVDLASLLASRLCHDLANSIGAVNTGLGLLVDDDADPELRNDAADLVTGSVKKTIDILAFARITFGASGGLEGDLDLSEAKTLAAALFTHGKAALDWQLATPSMPKADARALLNVLLLAEKGALRAGSTVRVAEENADLVVTVEGPKIKVSTEIEAAMMGRADSVQAKETPAYLAYLLAEACGRRISVTRDAELRIEFRLTPKG